MRGMPIALILCVLPVMFIVTLLFSVSGDLAPVPMVGFVALAGLVGIVFISLIRQMLRMQPTEAFEEKRASVRHLHDEERQHARDAALAETARRHEIEGTRARWQDDGGAGRRVGL